MTPTLQANPRAHALMEKALSAKPPRLDLASIAICALEAPDLDARTVLWTLDALAERVKALHRDGGELEGLQALRRVLADEEGFRGDTANYAHPHNSQLHLVLERRLGLPITLSTLYLEVARRAGIPLYGVSFPGHFVVAANVGQGTLVLDPFNGGNLLTESGCEELLAQVSPQLKFRPSMLRPTTVQAIAFRTLGNLKRQYLKSGDGARTLAVVDLMLRVIPDHPGELRTRANLLSTFGAYRAALADIERCLELSPRPPDHANLVLAARELRQRVELLN